MRKRRLTVCVVAILIAMCSVPVSCGGSADTHEALLAHLRSKASAAKEYCKEKDFSERYCILVNFSIHSGEQRFFIWDFEKDTIVCSSLCAHGEGKGSTAETPIYSNVEGSHCSSLGKYKTGARAYSQWGINVHYKLQGLEPTTRTSSKLHVVLHS